MAKSIPLGDVTVNQLYVDVIDHSRLVTDVYGNGKMQALVFPYAVYNGSDTSVTKDDLMAHVKKHVDIYVITSTGDKVPLDWVKSFESNEYNHDINHGASSHGDLPDDTQASSFGELSVIVPFYFTVPVGNGVYNWVAKYNGRFTPDDAAVTVRCHTFSVTEYDFDIVDIDTYRFTTLRAIRYTHNTLPSPLKLVKCLEYKGIRFDTNKDGSVKGNCWVSFITPDSSTGMAVGKVSLLPGDPHVGVFLDFKIEHAVVATLCYNDWYSPQDCTIAGFNVTFHDDVKFFPFTLFTWSDPEHFSPSQIATAWAAGIAMLYLKNFDIYYSPEDGNVIQMQFLTDRFKIEDNYGNMMKIDINVNKDQWTIKNPTVVLD